MKNEGQMKTDLNLTDFRGRVNANGTSSFIHSLSVPFHPFGEVFYVD
jgi:hypothetical protein